MSSESPQAPALKKQRKVLLFLRDVLVIIVIAALVSFLVKTFVVRSFYIPSGSMERTLLVNDRILVDELTPRWTGYQRGDVVVFKDPGGWLPPAPQRTAQPPLMAVADAVLTFVGISTSDTQDHLVKRIIGLPGDQVVCCNTLGQITVNGTAVDESGYLNLPEGSTLASEDPFDVIVPEDSLWLLGDNRSSSSDARAHQDLPSGGFVPMKNVVGRAFLTTWPLNRIGLLGSHTDAFSTVPDPE